MMKRLLALSTLVLLSVSPAWAGFRYIAETSTEGERGDAASFNVEAWIDGGKAKVVFTESGNPMMPVGSFLLTADGGETLYLVDPEKETYSRWDIDGMMESLGGAMDAIGGMIKMEVSDPKVVKLVDEDGGTMLGYKVRHYQYNTSYTMNMKVMGMNRGDHYETLQDMWVTDAVADQGFGVWLRGGKSTGFEAFDKLLEAELEKVQGFPLKSVSKTTATGVKKGGRSTTTTTTLEVSLLEKTSVAGDIFELDPSFEEVPMMVVPGMVPADDSQQPQQEEEKGGRFGKWKKKLGG